MPQLLLKYKIEYKKLGALAGLCLLLLVFGVVWRINAEDRNVKVIPDYVSSENSYLLRVTSGVNGGAGVSCFEVKYKDDSGNQHTEVILPNDGDYAKSYTRAYNTGSESTGNYANELRNTIAQNYNYQVNGWEWNDTEKELIPVFSDKDSLQAYTTDEFVFTTQFQVDQFVGIEVIFCEAEKQTTWTCAGMQIIKLDENSTADSESSADKADVGVTMNGIYSDKTTMLYSGTVYAEVSGSTTGEYQSLGNLKRLPIFGCSTTGHNGSRVYNISTTEGEGISQNNVDLRLDVKGNDESDKVSKAVSSYIIKIDLADITGAGEQDFMSTGEPKTLNQFAENTPLEHLSVGIEYKDNQGQTQNVVVPATLLEAAAQKISETDEESVKNDKVIGAFLQGESYIFPVQLVDMSTDNTPTVTLYYGENTAAETVGITYTQKTLKDDSAKSIRVTGIQIYDGDEVTYTNKGSHSFSGLVVNPYTSEAIFEDYPKEVTVSTDYDSKLASIINGDQTESSEDVNPIWYFTASSIQGLTLRTGTGNSVCKDLKVYEDGKKLKPESDVNGKYLVEITTDKLGEGETLNYTMDENTEESTGENAEELFSDTADENTADDSSVENTVDQQIDQDITEVTGTEDPLYITITYKDIYGNTHQTDEINIKEAVHTFYGDWPMQKYELQNEIEGTYVPTSDPPTNDGGYILGASAGGTLRFTFDAVNLSQVISCKIRKVGTDDYQLKTIYVKKLVDKTGYGSLTYYLMQDITVGSETGGTIICGDYRTNWKVDREVSIEQTGGSDKVVGKATPEHGILIQDAAKTINLGYANNSEYTTDPTGTELDWSKYYENMTYEQTKLNFGLCTIRGVYAITVKVADDEGTTVLTGDSGSVNMFYFQLIFKSGKTSAYVLANQQLEADAFRSGMSETFYIYTNYDYGEVAAVRIIPDDVTEDSDDFDKLQIDKISVSKSYNISVNNVWNCDDVGWIGIDYNDTGAQESIQGQEARYESEIAHTYQVTSTSSAVNLLFYMCSSADNEYILDDGTMSMEIVYLDQNNEMQTLSVDVYKAMYDYMNQTPKLKGGDGTDKALAVIDPDTMLRNGIGNYFEVTINDPKTIKRLEFNVTEPGSGAWNLEDVYIYQILSGTGDLYIDNNGIYQKDYTVDLAAVCTDSPYTCRITGGTSSFTVNMACDEFVLQSDGVVSTVKKQSTSEAALENTSLNVYAYVDEKTQNLLDGSYSVTMNLTYNYDNTSKTVSGIKMPFNTSGDKCVFTYTGLSTPYMNHMVSLTLTVKNGDTIVEQNPFTKVVVEKVSLGTVIETYEYDVSKCEEKGGGTFTFTTLKGSSEEGAETQMLYLSIGENCVGGIVDKPTEANMNVVNDLAVAIQYRSVSGSGQDVATGYYFYSDLLYDGTVSQDSITPGSILAFPLQIGNVSNITAVRLVAKGSLKIDIDAVSIGIYPSTTSDASAWYTFEPASTVSLSEIPQKITVTGARNITEGSSEITVTSSEEILVPVTMKLTMEKSYTVDDISMVMQYTDDGSNASVIVGSLKKHLSAGSMPGTSTEAVTSTFTMMLPNITRYNVIQSVQLEPIQLKSTEAGSVDASGTVTSVEISVGRDTTTGQKTVEQLISENNPGTIVINSKDSTVTLSAALSVNGIYMDLPTLKEADKEEAGSWELAYDAKSSGLYMGPFNKYVPATEETPASGTILTIVPSSGSTFVTDSDTDVSVTIQKWLEPTNTETAGAWENCTDDVCACTGQYTDSMLSCIYLYPKEAGSYMLTISHTDMAVVYKFIVQ